MSEYAPKHQRQLNPQDPYGSNNCAAYAMAMAIDKATHGGLLISGKTVRELTDEPIPDPLSKGLTLGQILRVSSSLGIPIIRRTGDDWDALIVSLKTFRGVLLAVDYGSLPARIKSQLTFYGNHMLYLQHLRADGTTKLYDPLATGFKWVPLSALHRGAHDYGRQVGVVGPVWANTRPDPQSCLA